jgi:hypothetical protein
MFVLVGTDSAGRALAAEIVSRLTARACDVIALPLTSSSDVLAGIAAAEALGPVRHLVLAAPWSAGEDWVTARESAVNAGYFACQRFLAARTRAGDSSRSTLTAVTGLGGDFGLGGHIGSVVGGAYAGLCKNLAREYSEVQIRVADFATAAPVADVAARVIAEVGTRAPDLLLAHADRLVDLIDPSRHEMLAFTMVALSPVAARYAETLWPARDLFWATLADLGQPAELAQGGAVRAGPVVNASAAHEKVGLQHPVLRSQ